MSFRIRSEKSPYHKITNYILLGILGIGTFFLPLTYLPYTKDILNLPKSFLFFSLVLVGVLTWLVDVVLSKRLVIKRTILDIPILVLLGVYILATITSVSPEISFWGKTQNFVLHASVMMASASWFWLCVQVLDTYKKRLYILSTLLVSGVVSGLIFLASTQFKLFQTLIDYGSFNTVSELNSLFGIFIGTIGLIAGGMLLQKGRSLYEHIIPIVAFLVSIIVLTYLGFAIAWGLFAGGMALLLVVGTTFLAETRVAVLSVMLAGFLLALGMLFIDTPDLLTAQVPYEISLGNSASFDIATDTFFYNAKHMILGSGPGTFMHVFSLFRDASFNTEQLAWSVRFHHPFNSMYAFITETGIVGFASMMVVILLFLGSVISSCLRLRPSTFYKNTQANSHGAQENSSIEILSIVAVWFVLTIGFFLTFYDFSLWWLWWTVLAVSVGMMKNISDSVVEEKQYLLQVSPQYSLVLSFGVVISIGAMVLLGGLMSRMYLAEVAYTKASSENSVEKVPILLEESIRYRGKYSRYHTALARSFLQQARSESEKENANPEIITKFLVSAVNEAKIATDIDSKNVETWETLALMYVNARAFAPEANKWALDALDNAIQLEPTNPLLHWHKGGTLIFNEDLQGAADSFKESIRLKSDYVGAYQYLSLVYEQMNDLDAAIGVFSSEKTFALVQNNYEILFDLGRMFYNRNNDDTDNKLAEQMWLRALELQPNFSNAMYSLGLLYEREGEREKAIAQFEKVKELNPNNKSIVEKIESLLYNPAPVETIPTELFSTNSTSTSEVE